MPDPDTGVNHAPPATCAASLSIGSRPSAARRRARRRPDRAPIAPAATRCRGWPLRPGTGSAPRETVPPAPTPTPSAPPRGRRAPMEAVGAKLAGVPVKVGEGIASDRRRPTQRRSRSQCSRRRRSWCSPPRHLDRSDGPARPHDAIDRCLDRLTAGNGRGLRACGRRPAQKRHAGDPLHRGDHLPEAENPRRLRAAHRP